MIRHYSSIIFTCHPFQPSPKPLLRVVLIRSVLLLKLQNYKKVLMSHRLAAFGSQCQWTRILISLTTPMAMGTQLGLKWHRESHYSSPPPLLRCAHKRHRVQNPCQLFRKSWHYSSISFTCHPFKPRPYHCWGQYFIDPFSLRYY